MMRQQLMGSVPDKHIFLHLEVDIFVDYYSTSL